MGIGFIEPTEELINDYSRRIECIMKEIWTLESSISLLTESRDRLLPKLMSGEIEL